MITNSKNELSVVILCGYQAFCNTAVRAFVVPLKTYQMFVFVEMLKPNVFIQDSDLIKYIESRVSIQSSSDPPGIESLITRISLSTVKS